MKMLKSEIKATVSTGTADLNMIDCLCCFVYVSDIMSDSFRLLVVYVSTNETLFGDGVSLSVGIGR